MGGEDEYMTEKEIYRLKGVASYETHQNHGDFLKTFLVAFLRADPANSRILLSAMKEIEAKYRLTDPSPIGVD